MDQNKRQRPRLGDRLVDEVESDATCIENHLPTSGELIFDRPPIKTMQPIVDQSLEKTDGYTSRPGVSRSELHKTCLLKTATQVLDGLLRNGHLEWDWFTTHALKDRIEIPTDDRQTDRQRITRASRSGIETNHPSDPALGSLLKGKKTTERGLAHNGFRALPGSWTEARLKPNPLIYANITWYSLAAVRTVLTQIIVDLSRSSTIPGHSTGS